MPENKNSMLPILLAFAAGVALGVNWPKMEKYLEPYMKKMGKKGAESYDNMIKFFAEQKEGMDDALAEAKVTKKKVTKKKKAKAIRR
ncbi:MAG: hypothetical protein IMZ52_01260 [Actinobacteria bacterium]|nr:hypothetical protein [Candidatus Atribacteria bacterium]MBE3093630.1 hypothetical protein [Actinomycetota bacterium]MBE3127071.1 hypothetical protein [Candidatus Atribacteria bacterium]